MTYTVELTAVAAKDVHALADDIYARMATAIDLLQDNPRPAGARKLRGQQRAWRIRVGDYRVLYQVDDRQRIITVYRIRHRREAYR